MGKVLSILIGLILMALGVWGIVAWPAEVVDFLKAAIVFMAIIIGLGIFVFGLSELRAGAEEPPMVEPAPAPERPAEDTSAGSSESEKGTQ
jgi:hypothetical protein